MNEALGFCFFNNVAIAARYQQIRWNAGRIGIVDFDVHHGNGTQHTFAEDPNVLFYSIHALSGTGREFEKGCLDRELLLFFTILPRTQADR